MSTKKRKTTSVDESEERFEVTVWDHEGNVVKVLRDATYDEAHNLADEYEDDPFKTVVIEDRP